MPSLHNLHLDGYDFNEYPLIGLDETRDRWFELRSHIAYYTGIQSLRPTPRIHGRMTDTGANLIKWKAAMDWTELRDLELKRIDPIFFALMEGELPALESLRLGRLNSRLCQSENTTRFLTQLNPLSRLSLRGHTNSTNFTQILDRHGGTLQSLEVREWQRDDGWRSTPSGEDLQQISQKCPLLSNLGVELTWNGSWPFDTFDILAANENLSSLQIFFEASGGVPFRALVNTTSSLDIFKHLRAHKRGVDLTHLRVNVGDVDRENMLYLDWFDEAVVTYSCSVLDSNGQRKAEGVAWCERVNEEPVRYDYNDLLRYGEAMDVEGDEEAEDWRRLQAEMSL